MIKQLCISEGQKHLRRVDKTLADIMDRYGYCTLCSRSDYFVVLCESIISQQLSVKAADTIYCRFCTLFDGNTPQPEKLLGLDHDIIRQVGISKQKTGYLKDLARKFVFGDINPSEFENMGDEDIINLLVTVKGIGRWTAEMFLIFALNRSDVLPVDDLGLRKAVLYHYNLKELPAGEGIREIANSWHPYATLATWYLWRSLENK